MEVHIKKIRRFIGEMSFAGLEVLEGETYRSPKWSTLETKLYTSSGSESSFSNR